MLFGWLVDADGLTFTLFRFVGFYLCFELSGVGVC